MDPLEQFADSLMKEAGLDKLPPDIRATQKEELLTLVQNKIGADILSSLPPEAQEKYLALVKTDLIPDPQALQDFLSANLPNYEVILTKSLQDFSLEYLSGFNK